MSKVQWLIDATRNLQSIAERDGDAELARKLKKTAKILRNEIQVGEKSDAILALAVLSRPT